MLYKAEVHRSSHNGASCQYVYTFTMLGFKAENFHVARKLSHIAGFVLDS